VAFLRCNSACKVSAKSSNSNTRALIASRLFCNGEISLLWVGGRGRGRGKEVKSQNIDGCDGS